MTRGRLEPIDPSSLGAPRGYTNGMLVPADRRLLFVAGQVGWDERQEIVSTEFAPQFGQALSNVLTVVEAAGGAPEDLVRLTIFVTTLDEYLLDLKAVGVEYRRHMGRHFPAMSLVEVRALLEPGAKVEIEATAAIS